MPDTISLSTKGQIVIPKALRDRLHWTPGMQLTVRETDYGLVIEAIARPRQTTLQDVIGCLKYTGPAKTLAQMDEGIGEAVAEEYERN